MDVGNGVAVHAQRNADSEAFPAESPPRIPGGRMPVRVPGTKYPLLVLQLKIHCTLNCGVAAADSRISRSARITVNATRRRWPSGRRA